MAIAKTETRKYDEGTEFLSEGERETFLRTIRNIAETAIKAGCRELLVSDLHTLQALEDKNEANFEEWING